MKDIKFEEGATSFSAQGFWQGGDVVVHEEGSYHAYKVSKALRTENQQPKYGFRSVYHFEIDALGATRDLETEATLSARRAGIDTEAQAAEAAPPTRPTDPLHTTEQRAENIQQIDNNQIALAERGVNPQGDLLSFLEEVEAVEEEVEEPDPEEKIAHQSLTLIQQVNESTPSSGRCRKCTLL